MSDVVELTPEQEKIIQKIDGWDNAIYYDEEKYKQELKDYFGIIYDAWSTGENFVEFISGENTFYEFIKNYFKEKIDKVFTIKECKIEDYVNWKPPSSNLQPENLPSPKPHVVKGSFLDLFSSIYNNIISLYALWGFFGNREFDLTGTQASNTLKSLQLKKLQLDFFGITNNPLNTSIMQEVKDKIILVRKNAFRKAFYNVIIPKLKDNTISPQQVVRALTNWFNFKPKNHFGLFTDKYNSIYLYEAFIQNFNDINFYPFNLKTKKEGDIKAWIENNDVWNKWSLDSNEILIKNFYDGNNDLYYKDVYGVYSIINAKAIESINYIDTGGGHSVTQSSNLFYFNKGEQLVSPQNGKFLNEGSGEEPIYLLQTTTNIDNINYERYSFITPKNGKINEQKFIILYKVSEEYYNKARLFLKQKNLYGKKQYYKKYYNTEELPQINIGSGDNTFTYFTEIDYNSPREDFAQKLVDYYSKLIDTAISNYLADGHKNFNPLEIKGKKLEPREIGEIKKKIKNVYPSTFANQKLPLTPYVQVEMRTKFTATESDESGWTPVIFNPNCHFISMDLDDNKGVKKLSLTLFDKYYTFLEEMLVKAIATINIKTQSREYKKSDNEYITYVLEHCISSNLRIKFGYNFKDIEEIGYDKRIKDTSLNIDNSDQPVYRTPWLYFQILNFNQQATDAGLNVTIEAINSVNSTFSQIKLLKKFLIIRGVPQNIIDSFRKTLNKAYGSTGNFETPSADQQLVILPFNTGKTPDLIAGDILNTDKEHSMRPWLLDYVELPIGEKERKDRFGNTIEEYKTFKEILDLLCSKVPPLYIDESNNIKVIQEGQEDAAGLRILTYTYSITTEPLESDKTKERIKVRFYYANPDDNFTKERETKVRTYIWRNYGASVIKNMNISTETDFAQLNMPVIVANSGTTGTKAHLYITHTSVIEDKTKNTLAEEQQNYYLTNTGMNRVNVKDVDFQASKIDSTGTQIIQDYGLQGQAYTNQVNQLLNNMFDVVDIAFCGRGIEHPVSGDVTPESLAQQYIYQVVKNLNSSIFKGTVEILGDPFYLFDENLEPYKYLIRLVIIRPDDKKIVYNENEPETNQRNLSYLSGYYVITNIKHSINNDGYNTTLEVMRWPSIFEIPLSPDKEKIE